MAQSGGSGDILKIGILGVGAYFLWQWWQGQAAPAASVPSTGTGTPTTTGSNTLPVPVQTTPTPTPSSANSLAAKLIQLGGQGPMNADNWSYYFTQVNGAALTPAQFQSAFPAITASDRGSTMTAQQFVAALASAGLAAPAGYGLNGLGQVRVVVPIPVPMLPQMPPFPIQSRAMRPWGRAVGWQPRLIPVDSGIPQQAIIRRRF
jgi:hypothetical protein